MKKGVLKIACALLMFTTCGCGLSVLEIGAVALLGGGAAAALGSSSGGSGGSKLQPPAEPITPSPAHEADNVSNLANLSWTALSGADGYRVYLGKSFNPPLVGENSGAASYDPGPLDYESQYYWKVVAFNDAGNTTSALWSFTVAEQLPADVTYVSPADGLADVSINGTTLDWNAAARADGYALYFGTTNPPALGNNFTATEWDTGALDYETTYYWRVESFNTAGVNDNAAAQSFRTVDRPRYAITLTFDNNGGDVTPSETVLVPLGENQAFTFAPLAGWRVRDVIIDNASLGSLSGYTFYDVSENHSIEVFFYGVKWHDAGLSGAVSAREAAAMVYDSAREEVFIFGGLSSNGSSTYYSEGYAWDGWAWEGRSVPGVEGTDYPARRAFHAMAFDSARNATVLFGGKASASTYFDTWEWNGSGWTDVSPNGTEGLHYPTGRAYHAMAFDASRGLTVLHGGSTNNEQTWEWNGSYWSNVTPSGTEGVDFPDGRQAHTMVYDSLRGVCVLFGGVDSGWSNYYDDTWVWNGDNWTDVTPSGFGGVDFPDGRCLHSAAFDARRGVVVLFGGRDGSTEYFDLWEWNGTDWTEVTITPTSRPGANLSASLAYDPRFGEVVLFGGRSAPSTYHAHTWLYYGE